MTTLNKVVPGKTILNGIISGETFDVTDVQSTSAAHFPDFAAVTPKGSILRKNVAAGNFLTSYGNVTDPYGMFYNPITYGISKLSSAGQGTFGFKRLTNNTVKARAVFGIALFETDALPKYNIDASGDYVIGPDGKPVQDGVTKGIFAATGYMQVTAKSDAFGTLKSVECTVSEASGNLKVGDKGTFYPIAEMGSGVGSYYNSMYMAMGHISDTDWNEVARFVLTNGTYPFMLNIGNRTDAGLNVASSKLTGGVNADFTLYDVQDVDTGIKYSLKAALGEFTGLNVNRPVEATEAPFDEVRVYQANLTAVCRKLYDAEYVNGEGTAPNVRTSRLPKEAIMNPIDLLDHFGKPYRNIIFAGQATIPLTEGQVVFNRMSLSHRIMAYGALNPYVDIDGKYPKAPTSWIEEVDGAWVPDLADGNVPTAKQYWQMNQALLQAYLQDYLYGKEFRDVIRNRTSFIWDLGYNSEVKDLIIGALAKRKDFIPVLDASRWLKDFTAAQTYSAAQGLNGKITSIPESDTYGAPATRASINLWTAQYMDEATYERFSLNIDLMCAFASAGGSDDGRISFESLPTEGRNSWLRIAHTPNVDFEDDDPAAQNLINGSVTLRPVNMTQWKRPALPTVYSITDSVLKDLPNVWYGVVMEKILQDQWILVSGSVMSAANYLATVRDNTDKQIHNQLGSCLTQWEVQTTFREASPNSRSIMYARVVYWVGKAKYMLDATLEARNEAELTTTA